LPKGSKALQLSTTFRNAGESEPFSGGTASLISNLKSSLGLLPVSHEDAMGISAKSILSMAKLSNQESLIG
jgi:hypothetical protein